jgi:hypothetical protein
MNPTLRDQKTHQIMAAQPMLQKGGMHFKAPVSAILKINIVILLHFCNF